MSSNYLAFAIEMAKYANREISNNFNQTKDIEIKSDKTLVTSIDKSINSHIIAQSAINFPDFTVLGEEESTETTKSEFTWVCDPIDGTLPFVIGMPTSTFSLALCKNGVPIVGIISHPFTNTWVQAEITQGAKDQDGNSICVNAKKLNDTASILNVDWWPFSEFDFGDVFKNLIQKEEAFIITPGSTCFAALMLAKGGFTASIFPGSKGKYMDMAAASLIVREAGGMATDFAGQDQRYDQAINGCLLSNGLVHETILQYLPAKKQKT